MRFEGTVKSWNDERAFGFIEPTQGGQEIFLHITALPGRNSRPALHQQVTFELELNRDGKKRAKNVQWARPAPAPRSTRRAPRPSAAQWGGATLLAIPAFVMVYLLAAVLWRVPLVVGAAYVGVSVMCFIAYSVDKAAAQAGRWRTPESTLLLMGVLCGWPGGLLAQQLLRHKSTKTSFRSTFWGTVVLNVGGFLVLSHPTVNAWHHIATALA